MIQSEERDNYAGNELMKCRGIWLISILGLLSPVGCGTPEHPLGGRVACLEEEHTVVQA